MSVSRGSVSGDQSAAGDSSSEALISGLNWLGDSIMSMPAIQVFRRRNPTQHITMLAKSWLLPLWRLHPDVDSVIELQEGAVATLQGALSVRRRSFNRAFVLPNSFRSALIPFLAGVPERVGMPGHCRGWMLTRSVLPPSEDHRRHQAFEYLHLMGLDDVNAPEPPAVSLDEETVQGCRERLVQSLSDYGSGCLVGMLPGASYGLAKRWSPEKFAEVGRHLVQRENCLIAVLGSSAEEPICAEVAAQAGSQAVNLAGKTSLAELAGILSLCSAVVSNDSGGMHLAAAVGAKVVAIFGLTDPETTGPLGSGHHIVRARDVVVGRDLERDSEKAQQALLSIKTEDVIDATLGILKG